MADASVSKTDVRKDVRVRLPLSAPPFGYVACASALSSAGLDAAPLSVQSVFSDPRLHSNAYLKRVSIARLHANGGYQAPPPPPPPPPPENPPPPKPLLLPLLGGVYEIVLVMLLFIDCRLLASRAA